MLARFSAFVIWAFVSGIAVFWGLRLFVHAPVAPSYAVAVGDAAAVRGDLSRLLGAAPNAASAVALSPEASSRFKLLGIVAPKYASGSTSAAHGVALIAIDGKMPRAYSVGARVDGDLVLQSVSLRTASISQSKGSQAITLELPLPTPAATGTLSAGASTGAGYVGPAPVPMPVPQYSPPPSIPSVPPNQGQALPPTPPAPRADPASSTQ
jgi:general secretion pathway protein C